MASPVLDPTLLPADAELQRRLSRHNAERMALSGPRRPWRQDLVESRELQELELVWVEELRAEVDGAAARAPSDPDGFVAWFRELAIEGPGQGDPLFEWLAERATREDLRWFVRQELGAEGHFGDLVAMTQVGAPTRMKLEMARNYWDEMGCGVPRAMHDPLLARLGRHLGAYDLDEPVLPEAMAVGNLMCALAAHRRYAYHSIGCLGAVELTSPSRTSRVSDGLERVGVPVAERKYYALHAHVDLKHAEDWIREVLYPAVRRCSESARWMAEGALLRLTLGARAFEAYRRELWGPAA